MEATAEGRAETPGDRAPGLGGEPYEDDLAEHVSFEIEDCVERLAELVAEYAADRERAGIILGLRLGLGGNRPETLTRIAARFDFSRDRARQLHTQAVSQLLRHTVRSGRMPVPEFARRYPLGTRDSVLTRALLAETYATDTDIAANDLAYLKLRLAGHNGTDAKRVAGYVTQRIVAWRKKTNHILSRLRELPDPAAPPPPWPERIEWPHRTGPSAPLPAESARTLDLDDDGRGRFYLAKPGREVGFDSALEARLLRLLNLDEQVRTFQEYPEAIGYPADDPERIHFPTVAVEFTDGRRALIDVQPLGLVALHPCRARAAAARDWAHENGWGWSVWTGSAVDVPALLRRTVANEVETALTDRLAEGPLRFPDLLAVRETTGMTLLDLAALVLRHEWRWDRAPFRLSAPAEIRERAPGWR